MTRKIASAHDRAIDDQFTRQAACFAARPELHADDVIRLVVDAAALNHDGPAIDLACGPGSVACALAERATRAVGLDSTPAMLAQARRLADSRNLSNVEWIEGSIYAAPFEDAAFAAVTCRFAFHHLADPPRAFAEMARLTTAGGRVVLCDAFASDDPAKARAFNAEERLRDRSTVEFRTLAYLRRLFIDAGLGEPETRMFQVPFLAADLVAASFPVNDDRSGVLALIESSVEGDTLGLRAQRTVEGVRVSYQAVVLRAIKPS